MRKLTGRQRLLCQPIAKCATSASVALNYFRSSNAPSAVKASTLVTVPVRSFSISLIVHLILVIVAGSAVLYRVTQDAPEFIASSDGLLSDVPLEPLKSTEPEVPSVNVPNPSSAPVQSSHLDTVVTTANSSFNVATAVQAPKITGIGDSAIADAGQGLGGAGGMGGRAGATMRMFGTAARGSSVVICFDVSGSMLTGRGKSEKTYAKLEQEIARVIGTFDLKTTFNLVAFSRDAETYREGLTRATSEEKQRAIAWLKKMTPMVMWDSKASEAEKAFHRGTRADRALEAAMKFQPDIIFFVSDGEPTGLRPDDILQLVTGAQQTQSRPTTINAIAYLADGGQRFMKGLAERNGGTYQEINPGDTE